jgi:DNA mismatch repair ATPase MutS
MNTVLRQYKRLKTKYPDAIVLCRIADDYQTFDGDAQMQQTF